MSAHGVADSGGGSSLACPCSLAADIRALEEAASPLDVLELAAAARAGSASVSTSQVQTWLSTLREGSSLLVAAPVPSSAETATAPSVAAELALSQLEAPAQGVLLVALGVSTVSDHAESAQPSVPPSAGVTNMAAQQLGRLHSNNRLLADLGAAGVYSALLQAAVSAHQGEIARMQLQASSASDASDLSAAAAAPRNPHDVLSRPASYWRTDRLLRQTLTLWHALVLSNRHSPSFVRTLLRRAYLPAALLELLSEPMLEPSKRDVLSPAEWGSAATNGSEEATGEFVVQYGSAEPSPRADGADDASGSAPSVTAASVPAVDPSTSIASAYWRRLASEHFSAGMQLQHISATSFLPLARVTALLRLVLELVYTDVSAASAPEVFAPAAVAAATPSATPHTPTASKAAAATGAPKSARSSVGGTTAAPRSSPLSSPVKTPRSSAVGAAATKPAAAAPKSPAKTAPAASSASSSAADASSGPVFCVRCQRLHCASADASCARCCPRTTRVLSAAAAAGPGFSVGQQGALHPFQLQHVCDVLATQHGPILFAPELVPAEDEADEDHDAAAVRAAGAPLLKQAALPVTRAFPFVVASASLPAPVRAQLSALAAHVALPHRHFEAQLPGRPIPGADVPLRAEELVAQLTPGLERGVGALARMLLALTPGFSPRRVVDGGAPAAIASAGGSVASSNGAAIQPHSFIELHMQLLSPSALSGAAAEVPDAALPFFARRAHEVQLQGVAGTLHLLRLLFLALPPCPAGTPGYGTSLDARHLCALYGQNGLAVLAAKCLSLDVAQSLARQTESPEALGAAWSVLRGPAGDAWTAPASSVPAVAAGCSTRLLQSLSTLTSLLRFVLDGGSSASGTNLLSASTLLSSFVALRLGVRRMLVRLLGDFLLPKDSPLVALAEKASPGSAAKEVLEAWRMEAALALRSLDPFLSAADIKTEAAAAHPLARARNLVLKHPDHAFHDGLATLLFRWQPSPWSELPAIGADGAADPAAEAQHGTLSLALQREAGLAARLRFPYGDAEALPLTRMPSTGMTMSPTAGGKGGGGGGGGIIPITAPVEPPSPGSGVGLLLQPLPPFAQALLDDFALARAGLAPIPRRALALSSLDSVTRRYPRDLDYLRLEHERRAKIDRILALQNRMGDFAQSEDAQAYDVFAPLSYTCAAYSGPAQSPTVLPASRLRVWHALRCADLQRRFQTEEHRMRFFGLEQPLVEPSLTHRANPAAIVAQREEREQRAARSQADRILAVASAAAAAEAPAADPEHSDYFSHPFLTRTVLTPQLLSRVLSPPSATGAAMGSGGTPASDAGEGAPPTLATLGPRCAGAAALATGRIAIDEADLRRGYAELIASANFD